MPRARSRSSASPCCSCWNASSTSGWPAAEVAAAADRAYDQLADGLGEYGKRG
jgi:hypothetical protein